MFLNLVYVLQALYIQRYACERVFGFVCVFELWNIYSAPWLNLQFFFPWYVHIGFSLKYEVGKVHQYAYSTSTLFDEVNKEKMAATMKKDVGVQLSITFELIPLVTGDEQFLKVQVSYNNSICKRYSLSYKHIFCLLISFFNNQIF